MPKAATGVRANARLQTPGAEGVVEDALLGGHTEGEAALEGEYKLPFSQDPKKLVAAGHFISPAFFVDKAERRPVKKKQWEAIKKCRRPQNHKSRSEWPAHSWAPSIHTSTTSSSSYYRS